ncbi:MAG: LURP-one-related family protein [Oscillospiraceae bacterium]|nr:LURP-one-related family protein [Oscillospiraceae bacterium]
MKLYIKQKVFSWRDRFAVKDEYQNDRWFAKGEMFSLGRKLHVYDANEVEVAFIRRKLFSFLPRYFIELGGQQYEFVKEFKIRPQFTIRNLDWVIDGNFLAHQYTVNNSMGNIMSIQKAWFSWGDSYELNIVYPQYELLCLCVVLAIDCIMADASSSSSNTIRVHR